MPRKPLEGLKVLDFCWVVVGPMTTKYLGEYGATVLRVESAKRPENLRTAAPFKNRVAGVNRSGYFANNNPNKYGVAIDMRHPRARDLALRMASWADLVAENFTPGTMESWGLGYGALREANPGIIMFSASMMGRGGPLESQPGFGPVLSSLAGLTHVTGWPDRDPVNPYGAYTDFVVPRFAVAAILAGLDYRRRTGEGMHLDMSQLEASIHFSAPFILDYTVNGREQGRRGNRDPGAAPHGTYPCRGDDRWIAIACSTDGEWQALRGAIDPTGHGWPYHGRFSTLLGRKSSEDDLGPASGGVDQRMGSPQSHGTAPKPGRAGGRGERPPGPFRRRPACPQTPLSVPGPPGDRALCQRPERDGSLQDAGEPGQAGAHAGGAHGVRAPRPHRPLRRGVPDAER